jgi:hypothetical protein
MSGPNPRDALYQIASLFGYDPTCVLEVRMTQYGAHVTYMVARTQGGFAVQTDGFLFSDLPPVPSIMPQPLALSAAADDILGTTDSVSQTP